MGNKLNNSCKLEFSNEVEISSEDYNNILDLEEKILHMVASNQQTYEILDQLCIMAESLLKNSVASILIKNHNGDLDVEAAPSIPNDAKKLLYDLSPGPHNGSCGNAVYYNKPQYIQNTFIDERWTNLREFARDFNICACWSTPITNENKEVIGSFALSSFEHRAPSAFHKKLLKTASTIISIVLKNRKTNNKMKYLAYHDELTDLYNKSYLENVLKKKGEKSLILLNINSFSYINTAYGFDIGDKILKDVSKVLKNNFHADTLCKINSDEFALVYDKEIDIKSKINSIQQYFLNHMIDINEIKISITFSYGATFGEENLLRKASTALKKAKESGKNKFIIFDKFDNLNYKDREKFIKYTNIIKNALDNNQIVAYFQGIYDNEKNLINKYEALVRIELEDKVISPFEFLEIAKLAGLIPNITKIMIKKSFETMLSNDYTFSINITEDDLAEEYLVDYLKEQASKYNINPNRVILEILEGVSTGGKDSHLNQLIELKKQGFKIAIDDFGAEYSNFERILDLDVDFIKIDAKYIKNIHKDKRSYEITKAIAFFAKNVNISSIAEFVHNEDVQKIIKELGINFSQGYLFSQPKKELLKSLEE
ncbi:sensor domain-containing diguanylate cyclase [Malaciobacter pacificus]|uniref:Diguanylate cyclase/phosphodiesterase n=1 Tax=Malaciobacter pacificus TaxID=1080223 RepID=A0A5C2H6J8_9BACT|nr:EAL domain-containing protein [Malaciobacter pacificus]QEP33818.1 diguanylate cyclase/phosphodiesterase [Malaciobacter pacificus]